MTKRLKIPKWVIRNLKSKAVRQHNGQNCSILSQKVPKFELYKHNDELFKIYYRIFLWTLNFYRFWPIMQIYWENGFRQKDFLWEFPIGSYVKLSSAVVAILVGVLKCRTQFWKRTTQEWSIIFFYLQFWSKSDYPSWSSCPFFIKFIKKKLILFVLYFKNYKR
jgi:hypothetical protein